VAQRLVQPAIPGFQRVVVGVERDAEAQRARLGEQARQIGPQRVEQEVAAQVDVASAPQ
jgi:hypothetical protein